MVNSRAARTVHQWEEEIAKAGSIREKVDLMNDLAWQIRIRDHERSRLISEQALALSAGAGGEGAAYAHGIAASLVTLSFLDGEAGNLDRSLARALEALSHIKEEPHPKILTTAWYVLGWCYYYMGDYPASLEFGLKSLKMAREAGLEEKESWCLDLVASTYKDPDRAVQMYGKHTVCSKRRATQRVRRVY